MQEHTEASSASSSSVAVSRINDQFPSAMPEQEQTVADKHEHACSGRTRWSGTMMMGYVEFTVLLIPISLPADWKKTKSLCFVSEKDIKVIMNVNKYEIKSINRS